MNSETILIGTVRGRVIELEQEPGLPDGQRVRVSLTPTQPAGQTPGEGLRASAGGWLGEDDEEEFQQWLAETYRLRRSERREPWE